MSDIIPFHEADFGPTKPRKYTHLREAEFEDGRYISAGLCDDGGWSIRIERDTADGKRSRLDFGLSPDAGFVLLRCMVDVLSDRDNADRCQTCSDQRMVEPRLIDTAPKTGVKIMGTDGRVWHEMYWWAEPDIKPAWDGDFGEFEPTHWLSLKEFNMEFNNTSQNSPPQNTTDRGGMA